MGPGDEVICVNATRACAHCGTEYDLTQYPLPQIGAQYIVERAVTGACVGCGRHHPVIRTVGCPLPPGYAWPMDWFRRLEYDEDQHIADAGVTLPINVKELV